MIFLNIPNVKDRSEETFYACSTSCFIWSTPKGSSRSSRTTIVLSPCGHRAGRRHVKGKCEDKSVRKYFDLTMHSFCSNAAAGASLQSIIFLLASIIFIVSHVLQIENC